MNARSSAGRIARRLERGASLLEGMVAILIFSIGILGLMTLYAASIKNTTDAQYRSEASYLVNSVIGKMRLHDQGTVTTDFASPNGAQYTQWIADIAAANATLPGMDTNPPTIDFVGRQATVWVFWKARSDGALRRHMVETQLDQ
jgi:type IV pilus assembly protein PilV